jgi:hypothetical protein
MSEMQLYAALFTQPACTLRLAPSGSKHAQASRGGQIRIECQPSSAGMLVNSRSIARPSGYALWVPCEKQRAFQVNNSPWPRRLRLLAFAAPGDGRLVTKRGTDRPSRWPPSGRRQQGNRCTTSVPGITSIELADRKTVAWMMRIYDPRPILEYCRCIAGFSYVGAKM